METRPDRSSPDSPLDALWQPGALVWAILVVPAMALILTLGAGPSPTAAPLLERFGALSFLGLWIVVLTLAGLYALRGPLQRIDPVNVGWVAFFLLVGMTSGVCSVAFLVVGELMPGVSLPALLLRAGAIAITVGLLSLGAFQTLWRNRQLRAQARESELAALRARIHPHFLFNTLNTAIALVRQRPDLVEDLLHDLSELFRASLATAREIPLADELTLCRRYLEIEKLRLGARLQLAWSQPDPLPELNLPALSVQPLVENAVRHGIEPLEHGGTLEVVVEADAQTVRIRIANPLPRSGARAPGHHVGQGAVRARIELATRGRGSLEAGAEGERYVAQLVLPRTP